MKLFSLRLCTFTFKLSCIAFFALLFAKSAHSQRDIEPKLIFSDTSSFQFTGEWQYLSTDIYLFNGEKFSNLINELDFVRNQPKKGAFRKKGLAEERLEYLFITANLKNVRFFGNNDITYPLYNFQISKDKENKYRTFVSDNIDHIRIIDNLPLYSANDFIDAEIRVKAITNSDQDQVLGLVASQLKNISKILNPTDALLGIIGEFGNFLESSTRKKEYRFSSTIRLFEQKNFDTKVHSIKVYALTTSNSQKIEVDALPFANLLDSVDHYEVNRQNLGNLISFKEYPLILVVNYKSLYKMEQLTGDEVTFANIEKRKLKVENDFRAGLINADTYRQEKDYINFLTVFANLKNHLDVYSLNYKTGNGDAISGSLFKLLQYYRQLLKTYDEINFKYKGNSTYQNVFSREYESIIGFANLYLDDDHNLKSLKALVNTLVKLETRNTVDKGELESTLSILRFADGIRNDQFVQSLEGQLINENIKRIEADLYKYSYEKMVNLLDQTEANTANKDVAANLKMSLQNTSCVICKNKGLEAINRFGKRMEEYYRDVEVAKYDSLCKILPPWIFKQLEKVQLVKNNLEGAYNNNSTEASKYLFTKVSEAERDVNNIKDLIKIDLSAVDFATAQSLNLKLAQFKRSVEDIISMICQLRPELCDQNFKQEQELKNQIKAASEAYNLSDSLVQQTNIFIAIFNYQLAKARNKTLSDDLRMVASNAEQRLIQLKVTIDILSGIKNDINTYNRIEGDVNRLIKEISDNLVVVSQEEDRVSEQL